MLDENREYIEFLKETEGSVDFEALYGFSHNCRCSADWEEGNVGLVSECYTRMCDDALERCHAYKSEVAYLERKMATLRGQVVELGGEPRD